MGKTVRSIGVTEFLNRTRMQRWPCFESTIRLREIRSTEGVIGTWGPWTRLGNLPWAELPASALGRFETLQQLWGEAEGVREGVRERMLGQEGDGHGEWRRRRRGRRGGGEAGASSEQLSHFVEDGLHGLLIESPELDLGNRVASKVSHKLLFFLRDLNL
jgi:hypothetical protein